MIMNERNMTNASQIVIYLTDLLCYLSRSSKLRQNGNFKSADIYLVFCFSKFEMTNFFKLFHKDEAGRYIRIN